MTRDKHGQVDQPSLLDQSELEAPAAEAVEGLSESAAAREPSRQGVDFLEAVATASVSSALWAAWADALGFISELTSVDGLFRRLGRSSRAKDGFAFEQVQDLLAAPPDEWPIQGTVAWSRRVGGQSGARVALPAGTYSDDTQLRLATSRCTNARGFDVERFAAIELPAFTCYGLGGGRATRDGAAAMAKPNTTWSAPGHDSWAEAGGNGVVMRVAPLAYAAAARGQSDADLSLDVLRNGVVTHGHPRALLPACLHAVTLAAALRTRGQIPMYALHEVLESLVRVPDLMGQDPDLGQMTLIDFKRRARMDFAEAWRDTIQEMHQLVELFTSGGASMSGRYPSHEYLDLSKRSGLLHKQTLGVGTACFVAAYWIAETFQDAPITGLTLAANAVGTDTDTIATIAGAHLGVTTPFSVASPLQDRSYIEEETIRLIDPAHQRAAASMRYPSLEEWRAPRVQADYVGIDPSSGRIAIAGLGPGEWISPPSPSDRAPEFAWQWMMTDYGQSVLVKRRRELHRMAPTQLPNVPTQGRAGEPTVPQSHELDELRARLARANAATRRRPRDDSEVATARDKRELRRTLDPDSALSYVREQGFSDEAVGRMLRLLSIRLSPRAAEELLHQIVRVWRGDED